MHKLKVSLLAQHISMPQVLICASTMRLEVRWKVAWILPHKTVLWFQKTVWITFTVWYLLFFDSPWSLYALFRKFCLFSIRKKVIWVWNEMKVSKQRQNFLFWVNYPFKSHSQSTVSAQLWVTIDTELDKRWFITLKNDDRHSTQMEPK